jgi:hypothetical protein
MEGFIRFLPVPRLVAGFEVRVLNLVSDFREVSESY